MAVTARSDSGDSSASMVAIWVKAAAQELELIISVSILAASSRGETPYPRRQPHMA